MERRLAAILTDDVAALVKGGSEVILVSSDAIAVGRRHLGLTRDTLKLEESQAAAATGQVRLSIGWETLDEIIADLDQALTRAAEEAKKAAE